MEKKTWKALAIIFIIIFFLETILITWSIMLVSNEEAKAEECFYEICGDYLDAWIEGNVCYCYEYDVIGNLVVAKTQVIK